MKKLLLFFFILLFFKSYAQVVFIPDTNFKAYLLGNTSINTNGDNEIQVSEANVFGGEIDCSNSNIYDLTGVESFLNVEIINCRNNFVDSVDFNSNLELRVIDLSNNLLTFLNLQNNSNLIGLNGSFNNLTYLDLDNNDDLINVSLQFNNLNQINLDNNLNIEYLNVTKNNLDSLDIQNLTNLEILKGGDNNIDSIFLQTNTMLYSVDLSKNNLNQIDVSSLDYLNYLNLGGNDLNNLDVSQNSILRYLSLADNAFNAIDVSSNDSLILLDVSDNFLNHIDLSSNSILERLYISHNNLTSIELRYNDKLETLYIGQNNISSFDLSQNLLLKGLYAPDNPIQYLDLSNNLALEEIHLVHTLISELDLSLHSELNFIAVGYCQNLKALNLANGNNSNVFAHYFINCPNLPCITVDDTIYSTLNWLSKDTTTRYSYDCGDCFTKYKTIDTSICVNDSLFGLNGQVWTVPGTFRDTLTNACQGDSIITWYLDMNHIDTSFLPLVSFCEGDTISFYGTPIYNSGVYTQIFTNNLQCDSFVIAEYIKSNPYTIYLPDTTICYSDTIYFNGNLVDSSGTYIEILTAYNGCDSLLIQNIQYIDNALSVFRNDFLLYTEANLQDYQWYLNGDSIEGANNDSLAVSTNGIYSISAKTGKCLVVSKDFSVDDINTSIAVQNESSFQFYPNPVSNILYIRFEALDYIVTLFDLTGAVVLQETQAPKTLSLENLSRGLYFIQVGIIDVDNETLLTDKLWIE